MNETRAKIYKYLYINADTWVQTRDIMDYVKPGVPTLSKEYSRIYMEVRRLNKYGYIVKQKLKNKRDENNQKFVSSPRILYMLKSNNRNIPYWKARGVL